MCRHDGEMSVAASNAPICNNSQIDYLKLPSVTEEELGKNIDEILERVNHGESPFLIFCNSGSNLLLFGWEDYWNRFGSLYPAGEKERVEEACRQAELQKGTAHEEDPDSL